MNDDGEELSLEARVEELEALIDLIMDELDEFDRVLARERRRRIQLEAEIEDLWRRIEAVEATFGEPAAGEDR